MLDLFLDGKPVELSKNGSDMIWGCCCFLFFFHFFISLRFLQSILLSLQMFNLLLGQSQQKAITLVKL